MVVAHQHQLELRILGTEVAVTLQQARGKIAAGSAPAGREHEAVIFHAIEFPHVEGPEGAVFQLHQFAQQLPLHLGRLAVARHWSGHLGRGGGLAGGRGCLRDAPGLAVRALQQVGLVQGDADRRAAQLARHSIGSDAHDREFLPGPDEHRA